LNHILCATCIIELLLSQFLLGI